FDRFEILLALCYADAANGSWGPPGRFAWKHSRGHGGDPYRTILIEAGEQRDEWSPVKAGLFKRSSARLLEIAKRIQGVPRQSQLVVKTPIRPAAEGTHLMPVGNLG